MPVSGADRLLAGSSETSRGMRGTPHGDGCPISFVLPRPGADAPPCPNQDRMNALAERAAVGIPAYGPPREGSAWGRKARQEANAAPARGGPACFQDVAWAVQPQAPPLPPQASPASKDLRPSGAARQNGPPRRESPLIPPRFRPAAVRPESRHPSCPPRGFQRKRKRATPHEAAASCGGDARRSGTGSKNALASFPLPVGRRFFLPRFAPMPEKSPGAALTAACAVRKGYADRRSGAS